MYEVACSTEHCKAMQMTCNGRASAKAMEWMPCQELQRTGKNKLSNCQELASANPWQGMPRTAKKCIGTAIQVLKQWSGCHAKNCKELARTVKKKPSTSKKSRANSWQGIPRTAKKCIGKAKEGHGHVLEKSCKATDRARNNVAPLGDRYDMV